MLQVERQKKDGKVAGVFRILSWVILTLELHVWPYKEGHKMAASCSLVWGHSCSCSQLLQYKNIE